MAVHGKKRGNKREERESNMTQMELAVRHEKAERMRNEDIEATLADADNGWTVIEAEDFSERAESFFSYRVSYLTRAAKESGKWYKWEIIESTEDQPATFRIVNIRVLAREYQIAAAKGQKVIIPAPGPTGAEGKDKINFKLWLELVRCLLDFCKADDSQDYGWNKWFDAKRLELGRRVYARRAAA